MYNARLLKSLSFVALLARQTHRLVTNRHQPAFFFILIHWYLFIDDHIRLFSLFFFFSLGSFTISPITLFSVVVHDQSIWFVRPNCLIRLLCVLLANKSHTRLAGSTMPYSLLYIYNCVCVCIVKFVHFPGILATFSTCTAPKTLSLSLSIISYIMHLRGKMGKKQLNLLINTFLLLLLFFSVIPLHNIRLYLFMYFFFLLLPFISDRCFGEGNGGSIGFLGPLSLFLAVVVRRIH